MTFTKITKIAVTIAILVPDAAIAWLILYAPLPHGIQFLACTLTGLISGIFIGLAWIEKTPTELIAYARTRRIIMITASAWFGTSLGTIGDILYTTYHVPLGVVITIGIFITIPLPLYATTIARWISDGRPNQT